MFDPQSPQPYPQDAQNTPSSIPLMQNMYNAQYPPVQNTQPPVQNAQNVYNTQSSLPRMQSMQVPVPPPPSRFNWLSWRLADIVLVLLPIGSFLLWVFSLKHVDVHQMNDLGLVSVLPLPIILAVILLNISFCFLLRS